MTPYLYHYLLTHLGNHEAVAKVMSKFGEVDVDEGRDRAGKQVHRIKILEINQIDLMYCYKDRGFCSIYKLINFK